MKFSRFTFLLGLSGMMILPNSLALAAGTFCTDSTLANMKSSVVTSSDCRNASAATEDKKGIDVDPYKSKAACNNTEAAIKKFYEKYESKMKTACGKEIPQMSLAEAAKCNGSTTCFETLANGLQPYIDNFKAVKSEFGSSQELLKKLAVNNGQAGIEITKRLGPSSPNFSKLKSASESILSNKMPGSISITGPLRDSSPEKQALEEINAGQKAVNLQSGISKASGLIDQQIAALSKNQNELNGLKGQQGTTDGTTDGNNNNNGNGNTDGGGFLSGMDPAKLMQMAATGLGLYQALNPQTQSGISPQTAPPGMNPTEKVTLSNKSGGTGTSAPGQKDPEKVSTPGGGSEGTGFSASAPYTPTSDISKTSDGNENKAAITTPSTGGSSENLGGSTTPNAEAKGAAETPKPTPEEEAMASMGGGLKYQGSSSSAAPELSAFDTSVKDILKDLDSNSGTENAFDGAITGENAENATTAAPFSGQDGIDGPDGASLFARMRSFHDRCLKRGCVLNGLGEKI